MGMDNRLKYNLIKKSVNNHALQDGKLAIAVVTDTNSLFYARKGKVIDYRDEWVCLAIRLEQLVTTNCDGFIHHQEIVWWFLPPNIKLVEW